MLFSDTTIASVIELRLEMCSG